MSDSDLDEVTNKHQKTEANYTHATLIFGWCQCELIWLTEVRNVVLLIYFLEQFNQEWFRDPKQTGPIYYAAVITDSRIIRWRPPTLRKLCLETSVIVFRYISSITFLACINSYISLLRSLIWQDLGSNSAEHLNTGLYILLSRKGFKHTVKCSVCHTIVFTNLKYNVIFIS